MELRIIKRLQMSEERNPAICWVGIPITSLGMMAGSVGILGIAIPVVYLILPSILGAYNKILTKRPIEAEISILRVTF